MEGEAFDPSPSPQSSLELEAKQTEEQGQAEQASAAQTWRDKVPQVVNQVMEHPYVAQGAETVRQTVQPLVNHPYVQKSTEILSKGAEQVSASAAQVKPLVLEPVVARTTETVQRGRETAKKIYNKEEGYEPVKVASYFAGSVGVLLLCILLAGWTSSDGRSKYNVDVSNIVAEKIQLPNGRHVAYVEQGASKEEAKYQVLLVHSLFSSRLLGLSGINENLLKKYSIRMVAYDRPGIGQSDPQLKRTMNTTAEDMADLADALGMGRKFWVISYSGGAAYAWAALHYIPNRLAGVAMLGPLINPYGKNITTEESKAMWAGMRSLKSQFQYARHLPSFLPGKLKGTVQKVNTYMRNSKKLVNQKDRDLLETDAFGETWERAIRESVRSGDPKPHAQDLTLQVQDWGFQLSDIRPKTQKPGVFKRILYFFGGSELPGFSGPIHIFHGTEDKVVPLVMSEHVKRVLPQVELHKLEGEGHYSWFFNCESCHRELLKTLFGEVAGLEDLDTSTTEAEDTPAKEVEAPVHHAPEGYFEHGPVKPEDGPLNDLTIAEKEAEKIALYKEAGMVPPIEPAIGISPEQYEELQHEIEVHKHEEELHKYDEELQHKREEEL
jgi:pimeloyl-ACP methyl ester carboxylesterase